MEITAISAESKRSAHFCSRLSSSEMRF